MILAQTSAIEIIKNTENLIQDGAQGTELYDVTIKILLDEIYIDCTCPYADIALKKSEYRVKYKRRKNFKKGLDKKL